MSELNPEECFTLAGYDADGILHLATPMVVGVSPDAPGWMTRCGLTADDGPWRNAVSDDSLIVCASCSRLAGIA